MAGAKREGGVRVLAAVGQAKSATDVQLGNCLTGHALATGGVANGRPSPCVAIQRWVRGRCFPSDEGRCMRPSLHMAVGRFRQRRA